jgi:hypothetical protein
VIDSQELRKRTPRKRRLPADTVSALILASVAQQRAGVTSGEPGLALLFARVSDLDIGRPRR